MWFCTEDGLNKYDGYKFTVYKHEPDNPNSLSSSHVWAAYEERGTHTLWVATSNGLDKLDLQTGQFVHYRHDEADPHSLSHNDVRAIHKDHTGTLWIATWGGGLNTFDRETGRFTRYQHDPNDPSSLSGNTVLWGNSIHEDPAGTLWIGATGGFSRFDRATGGFVSYQHDENNPNSVNSNYVGTFAAGKDPNVLWVGSADGLNKLDLATETFVSYPELEGLVVADTFLDQAGNLWLGTLDGLYQFDQDTETVLAHYPYDPDNPKGLAHNEVNTIFQDQTGILWIGTWGGGLNTLGHTKAFVSYQHRPNDPNSLSSALAHGLGEDGDGNVWIAGGAGLDKLDLQTGVFTHYAHDPNDPSSLFTNRVTGLASGRDGTLWVSTRDGLGKLDPQTETFARYQYEPNNPNSLLHNDLESVFMDSAGMLWISTWGFGTSRFDPKREMFVHYLHDPDNPQSISSDIVNVVYEDTHGTLWFGTSDGLDRFDRETETFRRYQHDEDAPESLGRGEVYAIYGDADDFLWIGLLGGGLNRLNPTAGTFRQYNQANSGLPNDTVNCILGDDQNYLWLATNDGVSKFDPDTGTSKNYSVGDGLPGNNFAYDACLKTSRGELVFGTYSSGFLFFHPDDIQDSLPVFPVAFTDFQLFDKPVDDIKDSPLMRHINFVDEITLSHEQNIFTLEFAALQYHNPQKHRYAYKMEGVDQDWVEVTSDNRSVRYTNLDPGEYVFTVKASNHDGVWDKEGRSVTIIVRPPWWETWWFRGGVLILLVGLAVTGVRWRVRVLEQRSRVLEAEVAERTKELAARTERLQESEKRFREMTELLPGAVVELDTDFTVTYVNRSGLEMFGHTPQDVQAGLNGMELIHPEDRKRAARRIEKHLEGKDLAPTEYRMLKKDGAEIPVLLNAAPIRQEGEVTGFRASIADIIEMKETEQELAAALDTARILQDEAEAANRAKSTFLANMSHELRTPLNAILGYAQLMARDAHTTPTQQEYLETIARSGEHLLGLINDVLTMSQIEAGRTTLQENAFDLHWQLRGLQEMFQLRADAKGLALRLDIAPDVPRYVYADEAKLRQVLMNLLGNAVKFTEQGRVALCVSKTDDRRPLRATDERPKAQPSFVVSHFSLVFKVEDTGAGIALEEMEALFDPFVQTASGQQSQEGTGLGLSISRQFVDLMGGELGAESIVGQGTTFRVQIPVALVAADTVEHLDWRARRRVTGIEPGQTAPDGGPFRLLVVEDDATNRELLIKLLAPFGFEVRYAVNGAEGVKMWEEWQPHLVWMDMQMPVIDGYEATRQIKARAQATDRQAIIIAVTASAFEEEREAILAAGCDDFVRKPFREGEIFDALHRHLGVRFIYETITPAPETALGAPLEDLHAAVATLPAAWAADLHQAATALDADQMLALIEAVRPQAPHLSDALAQWVRDLEYERLIALVAPEA
jgi:PAS domain S-box-containing protein